MYGPVLLAAVLVLLLLGGAGPAAAHAALRATDPGDGTVLKRAPADLTLTFTESVGLLEDSLRLLDPEGRRVRTGQARHAGGRSDTARVTLPAELGTGTYTVAWRVVSADSHPVSGAFTFSVGERSATPPAVSAGPVEDPLTGGLHTVARWLAHLSAALLVGAAAFVPLCRPPDPAPLRGPLRASWWTLLAATVVLLVLRAPYEAGTGPASALDASALGRTLTGRPGLALLARLLLLAPAAAVLARLLRRRDRPALCAGVVTAVGLAATWAAADHAVAGIQVPVAMVSAVLHLLATAVWLGGLAALLTLLGRSGTPVPAGTVTRFSRLALVSVAVLAVTGVYQSWRGLGSWSALTGTSYGRLLIVKLVAVAALLLAAGQSRRWTARLVTGDAGAGAAVPERVPEPVGGASLPLGVPSPPGVSLPPGVSSPPGQEEAPGPGPGPEPHPGPGPGPGPEPHPGPGPGPGPEEGTPPAAPDAHRRDLRRYVLAEAVIAVVVLAVTTVLTGTPPGRTAAGTASSAPPAGALPPASVTTIPFDVGVPGGRGTVQITLDPGRTGDNSVQAVVFGPDGGLTTVPELRLSFGLPARRLGPIDARLTDRGGYWGTGAVSLPLAGTWTMKATVRVSEVDQVSATAPVRITG
ncbi:hypothetical protein GCM10010129_47800 [Streptomyces fumigatiscleroticus]|nr:hypothetical protein GCM10010129_47800 [Streptomyces fumigatiscleroticus]